MSRATIQKNHMFMIRCQMLAWKNVAVSSCQTL